MTRYFHGGPSGLYAILPPAETGTYPRFFNVEIQTDDAP